MLELLLERNGTVVEPAHLTVDAHAREALFGEVLEQLRILALATAHDGREHERLAPRGGLENLVGDLVRRLALDDAPALGAVRHADARIQQAQVVVDLRDGAHRGARVARRRLLVDGHGGRQSLDGVDVRLVHLAEELARIARERLHIAALALGVDRVERQGALTRAGQACDDDELVARNRQVDVLEVVLASPSDDDAVLTHLVPLAGARAPLAYPG